MNLTITTNYSTPSFGIKPDNKVIQKTAKIITGGVVAATGAMTINELANRAKVMSENERTSDFPNLQSKDDGTIFDAYKSNGSGSLLHKGYEKHIKEVKYKLKRYKEVLPPQLYKDIIERYGTEEKSIMQILKDNSVELDSIPTNDGHSNKTYHFERFVASLTEKEKEFAQLRLANTDEKRSVVLEKAWTSSGLRRDLGNETKYGTSWSQVRNVWQKCTYPEKTHYSTKKLIDAYLVQKFKYGQRNYNGKNPLEEFSNSQNLDKKSINLLKFLYRYSRDLNKERQILNNPLYKQLKESVNIDEMAKTIEAIEEHYKNAFFKQFWTDERKLRFSEALQKEYSNFDKNVAISNELFEKIMNEVLIDN